jgi:hypothetical protein
MFIIQSFMLKKNIQILIMKVEILNRKEDIPSQAENL